MSWTRRFALLALLVVVPSAPAQKEFGFDNRKPSGQEYLKPEETVRRMKVADGFEVKLFAGELWCAEGFLMIPNRTVLLKRIRTMLPAHVELVVHGSLGFFKPDLA